MRRILFKCVPFDKNQLTLALESGVDGVVVPEEHVALAGTLSRVQVLDESAMRFTELSSKEDERMICERLHEGEQICLSRGWEIIPVENLLAENADVALEVTSLAEARLATGILEKGVSTLVVPPEGVESLKGIVAECKLSQGQEPLVHATVTRVEEAGLGHRVCVDTLSLMATGQGMLVGDSSAFTFLVHAETEHNEYVASRPFRINAGAVHAYVRLPEDKTCYLGELCAGRRVLVVDASGHTTLATVGRVKTEVRPMLLVEARVENRVGTVFLQNAETIRLVTPEGKPVSVVELKPGDEVLCRLDEAGRHFGMRVSEDIREQ